MNYKYWRITREDNGLFWVSLGNHEESANILTQEVMQELDSLVGELSLAPPTGVIFCSHHPAGFIAGANIKEFSTLDSKEKMLRLVERGWTLYNKIAALPFPTLSLIHGHCMGGGLELSLACRYRVVSDDKSTRLGLPEVMLGIIPGWGGMLRLPQLIGPIAAMDMMLTGRSVDGRRALQMGLADLCVPPRIMQAAAKDLVLSGRPAHQPVGVQARLMRLLNHDALTFLRPLLAKKMKQQVAKRAKAEHYPAPYYIIDCWAQHNGNALAAPQKMAPIQETPTAMNLVRIFHLQERLKAFGKPDKSDGLSKVKAAEPTRVHVVGAGTMGADIAMVCALKGYIVSLHDQNHAQVENAMKRAAAVFQKKLKRPLLIREVQDRLIPDWSGDGCKSADIVIEAIYENLEAKHKVLQALEQNMPPHALLATNTSSLPLEDLQRVLKNPRRLIGVHFFNPVEKMPLVEVITTAQADEVFIKMATRFVRRIDKLPLPVKSAPGFLVNAVLAPYMLEAMLCIDSGVQPELIDKAMKDFGMAMGPIELADTVGLDIAASAGAVMLGQGGGDVALPLCLSEKLAQKKLGVKTGEGFYKWENRKAQRQSINTQGVDMEKLSLRLIEKIIQQTQLLVDRGIVADADLADAGVIFGTGFAPHTGGPLKYHHYKMAQIEKNAAKPLMT